MDDWIGKILQRLDELGLTQDTLVIFTSDHGEMLGDHGMHSKMTFYEGAAHIPLLVRLPGVIPAGTVVKAPAAQIDLFATILDYLGQSGQSSEGQSLRPLIEGKDNGAARVAVSEWNSTHLPGFMVFDGRWKMMFGQSAGAVSLDGLYDLQTTPRDHQPDRPQSRPREIPRRGRASERIIDRLAGAGEVALSGRRQGPPRDRLIRRGREEGGCFSQSSIICPRRDTDALVACKTRAGWAAASPTNPHPRPLSRERARGENLWRSLASSRLTKRDNLPKEKH